ncbi:6-phospho-3-hexuloisomerase [Enterococcus gallinarum]|nr:6-phospho-3-hexuloisomerase [Enterococcus gallinarum]
MNSQNHLPTIIEELNEVMKQVDLEELKKLETAVINSNRIFVDGEGRSGFVGQCFAMRLMHLGFTSYVIGETVTPSYGDNDLLVCISGSGETDSVILNANKATKAGVKVISVTTNSDSSLGKLSESVVRLNATTRGDIEGRKSIQLLRFLFDQSVHIIFDNVCLLISEDEGISNEKATNNHV